MAKITIKATVEKVVIQNGKKDAQMVITIPASSVNDIPMGAVSIDIQTLQAALFGADKTSEGASKVVASKKKRQ